MDGHTQRTHVDPTSTNPQASNATTATKHQRQKTVSHDRSTQSDSNTRSNEWRQTPIITPTEGCQQARNTRNHSKPTSGTSNTGNSNPRPGRPTHGRGPRGVDPNASSTTTSSHQPTHSNHTQHPHTSADRLVKRQSSYAQAHRRPSPGKRTRPFTQHCPP
jgi:hypothetical protein